MKPRARLFPLSTSAALPVLAAALVATALAGAVRPALGSDFCAEDDNWSQTQFSKKGSTVHDIQRMHERAPEGTWRIDAGENGSVQLSAWDKNEVLICARITAWAPDKSRAERLLRSIHVETSGGVLRAQGPESVNSARWTVSFRIQAPRAMDLDVRAVNGGIAIEGIRGRMSLHTQNGPLAIERAGGDIEGRTTNGPLAVTLSGKRWQGRGLDLETSNGPVNLSIPEGYSAELTTGTTNGPVAGAYVGARRGRHGRHLKIVLGSGGAPIRVTTTNGSVTISKS